jgi:hypothetical protein
MSTQKQRNANRLNAQHSTGPASDEGKAAITCNALKHGFYANQFKPADLKDLEKCRDTGLNDEIAMLRVQSRRVIELSSQPQTLSEAAFTLRVLSLAALTINRLVRTLFNLGQLDNPIQDAFHQALIELGAYPGGAFDTPSPQPPPTN